MGSKKRQSVYPKKRVQGTFYITREAAQKMRAAMARGGRPGRRVTASDVVNFALLQAADLFDREAVAAAEASGGVPAAV